MATTPRSRLPSRKTQQWTYLEDPKRLKHICNQLDKAIAAAPKDESLESLEDFKNFVETFSLNSGKAPIVVELCRGSDDEIHGFRFYLESNPSERTSGKYLVKHLGLDRDENYFTPSNIKLMLAMNEDLNLDDQDPEVLEADPDLDLDDGDEQLDEELTEASEQSSATVLAKKLKRDQPSNLEIDEPLGQSQQQAEDDLDEDLTEEDIAHPASVLGRQLKQPSHRVQTPEPTQKVERRPESRKPASQTSTQRDPSLEEAAEMSERAATRGAELDGVNLAGLGGQALTYGFVLTQQLESWLEEMKQRGQEARAKKLLEQLQDLYGRTERLFERADHLDPAAIASFRKRSHSSDASEQSENAFAQAVSQVGERIHQVGTKLEPAESSIEPLTLDKDASISQQLDQLESYLNVLAKRLTRLETIVDRLEQQLTEAIPTTLTEATREPTMPIPPNASQQRSNPSPTVKAASVQSSPQEQQAVTQQVKPQSSLNPVQCAEALAAYAWVTEEVTERLTDGIALSATKSLYHQQDKAGRQIVVVNGAGDCLFDASQTSNQQWQIKADELSEVDKRHILKLPQTIETYQTQASAQALIACFQEVLPEAFNATEPSLIFDVKELSDQQLTYSFEVIKQPNGQQLLLGADAEDNLVLDAMIDRGKPATIHHCSLSVEEMEAFLATCQVLHQSSSPQSTPSENPDNDLAQKGAAEAKPHKAVSKQRQLQA